VIRYIDLSKELEEAVAFAWLDTVDYSFKEYMETQVWLSFKNFESDLLYELRLTHTKENIQDEMLGRFRVLYPPKQTSPA
jgi:hypothetical protein